MLIIDMYYKSIKLQYTIQTHLYKNLNNILFLRQSCDYIFLSIYLSIKSVYISIKKKLFPVIKLP